jgi:hypothetical protein
MELGIEGPGWQRQRVIARAPEYLLQPQLTQAFPVGKVYSAMLWAFISIEKPGISGGR